MPKTKTSIYGVMLKLNKETLYISPLLSVNTPNFDIWCYGAAIRGVATACHFNLRHALNNL